MLEPEESLAHYHHHFPLSHRSVQRIYQKTIATFTTVAWPYILTFTSLQIHQSYDTLPINLLLQHHFHFCNLFTGENILISFSRGGEQLRHDFKGSLSFPPSSSVVVPTCVIFVKMLPLSIAKCSWSCVNI